MDSQLESRRKTGDWEDKNVIYEDEKPFMEDFKQVSESFSNNEGDALLYYAGEGFWAINNVLRNKDGVGGGSEKGTGCEKRDPEIRDHKRCYSHAAY